MLRILDKKALSKSSALMICKDYYVYYVFLITAVDEKPNTVALYKSRDVRKAFEHFEDYYKMNYCMEELYGRV